MPRTTDEWKRVLRTALTEAMRARQHHVIEVLRETLAAIDNAEAAHPSTAPQVQDGVFAASVPGLGAGEVPRRVLSAEEATAIVQRERTERQSAAATYAALGKHEEADRLIRQADVLASLMPEPAPSGA